MSYIETVLRDTLHDEGLATTARPDLAAKARREAKRQTRRRQAAGAGLVAAAASVSVLVGTSLAPDHAAVPADGGGPSPSVLPECGAEAGTANAAPTAEADALRTDIETVLPLGWQIESLRSLPPCDEPGAPALPYRRTAALAEAMCVMPHQILRVSRTRYDPRPTPEQMLANAQRPPILERTRPDGSFALVYVRASPAQSVRVAAAVAADGTTATVEMPPQGDPLSYGLSIEAAADLAEALVRKNAAR